MAAAIVELDSVTRCYRRGEEEVRALRGVSLHVAPAEFVVVTGPSGSGKSTLLHVMAGLDRPDSGEIRLGGKPLSPMPGDELTFYRRPPLGCIFPFFPLFPTFSAGEKG